MRSHNTSFFVFSLVLSLSLLAGSLFYGGKVKAASPIFYDASFTFLSSDYTDSTLSTDYSYHGVTFGTPFFNSAGIIHKDLGSYLTNDYSTAGFTNSLSNIISVACPDLLLNGGTLYLGYVYAFYRFGNYNYTNWIDNYTFTSYGNARWSLNDAGNVIPGDTRPDQMTFTFSYLTGNNTYINGSGFSFPETAIVSGFQRSDGSNFPIGIGVVPTGSTSQLLDSLGLENSKFYNYGISFSSWWRSNLYQIKVVVEPRSASDINKILVFRGSAASTSHILRPFNYQATITVGEESENINLIYMPIVYLCPVYAFAVSNTAYDSLEEILNDINGNLSSALENLNYLAQLPSSDQVAWIESMARKASTAQGDAQSLATRSAYSFSKPNGYVLESQLTAPLQNQQALPLMSLIQGFLSHTKILAILTLAVVASIIGYIFFGKRG